MREFFDQLEQVGYLIDNASVGKQVKVSQYFDMSYDAKKQFPVTEKLDESSFTNFIQRPIEFKVDADSKSNIILPTSQQPEKLITDTSEDPAVK